MAPIPEVSFILDAINTNYGSALSDVPLQRIDRDNARNIDRDERVMADKDYRDNFVGASAADTQREAIGTEFDQRLEFTVNVRLQGTHAEQHGQIDPSGGVADAADWETMKDNVRRAIMQEREFPSVSNRPNISYCWIDERNEQDLSSDFKDKYRWEADYTFVGFDDLS